MLATLRRLLLVSVGAIALPVPGQAQVGADRAKTLSQAEAAYDRGDYAEAVRWYRLAADQGDASAQTNVGIMYANGSSVAQDYAEAARWYLLAADQNYALAQNNLGGLYSSGLGVEKNLVESYKWLSLAAAGGAADAIGNWDQVRSQ